MGGENKYLPGRRIYGARVSKIGLFTEAAFLLAENSPLCAITLIRAQEKLVSPQFIFLPRPANYFEIRPEIQN